MIFGWVAASVPWGSLNHVYVKASMPWGSARTKCESPGSRGASYLNNRVWSKPCAESYVNNRVWRRYCGTSYVNNKVWRKSCAASYVNNRVWMIFGWAEASVPWGSLNHVYVKAPMPWGSARTKCESPRSRGFRRRWSTQAGSGRQRPASDIALAPPPFREARLY